MCESASFLLFDFVQRGSLLSFSSGFFLFPTLSYSQQAHTSVVRGEMQGKPESAWMLPLCCRERFYEFHERVQELCVSSNALDFFPLHFFLHVHFFECTYKQINSLSGESRGRRSHSCTPAHSCCKVFAPRGRTMTVSQAARHVTIQLSIL